MEGARVLGFLFFLVLLGGIVVMDVFAAEFEVDELSVGGFGVDEMFFDDEAKDD